MDRDTQDALIAFLKAATVYLSKDATAPVIAPPTAGVAPKKAAKAPKVEPLPPVQPPSDLTPEELRAHAYSVAKEYVMRFSKSTPHGLERARVVLTETFKVPSIGKLPDADIPKFITTLEKEMETAGDAK